MLTFVVASKPSKTFFRCLVQTPTYLLHDSCKVTSTTHTRLFPALEYAASSSDSEPEHGRIRHMLHN
jgi:hypothetical protein